MDRDIGGDVEAQYDLAASNVEHRDSEDVLKVVGPSDNNRFRAFSRQD
jgi:hypothetical protein